MARIPDSFIQDLLNRVDIVDVVDRYVPLKKGGANYMACCPFHNEKSPSFTVSPTKQFYHCFGCGAHGTAITFMMEHAGLGFVDAVKELAQGAGMQVPQEEPTVADIKAAQQRAVVESLDLPGVMRRTCEYYREQLKRSPRAIQYLKKRGLSGEIAARFGLGYAPEGWQALEQAFHDYGANPALVESGLVKEKDGRRYDVFRDRVMFPIVNQRGAIIGFGGRVLDGGEPKYLNSPETVLFEKGRELYGLYQARQAIRDAGRVIVVEGYMDVVSLAQFGVGYAVATLGTSTTPFHIQKLMRQSDRIVFCFDGDKAGRKAAWRALENALPMLADDKRLEFLFLPETEDPDTYVRHFGKDAFEDLMERDALPLTAFMLRELASQVDLQSDEGRARLVKLAQPLVTQIQAQALSLMVRKRLAELLGIEADELDRLFGIRVARPSKRGKSAPAAGGKRQPLSRTRQIIQWLLRRPGWAQHIRLPATTQEDPETLAMIALQRALAAQPGMVHAAQVLEHFRDTEHEGLLRHVAAQAMDEKDAFSDDEAWSDLNGLLDQLTLGAFDERIDWLRRRSQSADFTLDEMKELNQLLVEKDRARQGAR
ncbi:DNA primase [Chitinivorax sp. PXF-14]|uniref:DNA primase n=1 Tax=Chitinivorax sp. PXF-14 TaxID=3230488 RepID=UPI003467ED92